jgi:hypothetical protein
LGYHVYQQNFSLWWWACRALFAYQQNFLFMDAGTKFFHANATIKHRYNHILSLVGVNGTVVTSYVDKEEVLFQSFKDRLGTS